MGMFDRLDDTLRGMQLAHRRRVVSAAVAFAVLTLVVLAHSGWDPVAAPAWTVLALVAMALAGMALATYVPLPGQGARLDLGCGSCAAAGGLMAVGSIWLVASGGLDVGNALLGIALGGAALAQRLVQPTTCAPIGRGSTVERGAHGQDEHSRVTSSIDEEHHV